MCRVVTILINCSYNSHTAEIGNHLAELNSFSGKHSRKYKKILILGDFNVEIDDPKKQTFYKVCNLKSLTKQPACYKNPDKPFRTDLILTNVLPMFQSTFVIETGLSDFHLMIVNVRRKTFKKVQSRIKNYMWF